MRAVVFAGYGMAPVVTEVAEPACPDGGAVLTVGATGLCRSDWHAWRGHEMVPLPHIPGHELAGVVAEVGPGVSRWRPGDRVTLPFVCGCGRCAYCLAGQPQVCPDQTQPGFTGPGSFAERVAIHAADLNLVALPDSVGFVAAASLGCRFATAYRAITAHGRPGPGDWLAVHGCGGVGLSAIMIGAAVGARVVAVDVSRRALDLARTLGAEEVVHADAGGAGSGGAGSSGGGSGGGDPVAAVRDITGGGAHVSLDAFGSAASAVASVRCLRRQGRHVQVGLLHGPDSTPPIPMDIVIAHELAIHGSHGMAAHEYPAMLAMVEDGTLRPELLVRETIGLDGAGTALAAMDDPARPPGITVITLPG